MERELLLLGLLRQSEMHGYKLVEFIERDLAICTDLKKPTAYFVLDRMAQNGWIAKTEEQQGNRPARHIYQITPAGEAQFQQLLRESLAHYEPTKFTSDIALAFADGLPESELTAQIEQRRAVLVAALQAAAQIPAHKGFVQLVVDHHRVHLESELRWIDELLKRISTHSTSGD